MFAKPENRTPLHNVQSVQSVRSKVGTSHGGWDPAPGELFIGLIGLIGRFGHYISSNVILYLLLHWHIGP